MALLSIQNLSVRFDTDDGVVHAVDDVSLFVEPGRTVCLVGESGCGKSVTALAAMRLIQSPPGAITGGKILFDGSDILKMTDEEIRTVRGRNMAMIFQDPMTSLNPVFTCGFQIAETLRQHLGVTRKEAFEQAVDLLSQVKIPDPRKRASEYPHQLSGGMRQRVMIAMALSCNPRLLIADEPSTALDVTVQAQILDLLASIKEQRGMAMLFITHDLGVVAEIADEVVVLYAGTVAERGVAADIYDAPRHPYTIGLLNSVPSLETPRDTLQVIPGSLPDPTAYTAGCRFYDRCSRRSFECSAQPPEFHLGGVHYAACFNMGAR